MNLPEEGMDAAVAARALDALEDAAKEVDDLAWPALREAARAYAAAWDDYRDPPRQARAQARLEDAARAFVAAEDHEPTIGQCDACCRRMTRSEVDAAIALGRDSLAIWVDSGPGRAAKTAPRPKATRPEADLARFAAEVKASVIANTHETGYVSLGHLYSLLDHAISKGTP